MILSEYIHFGVNLHLWLYRVCVFFFLAPFMIWDICFFFLYYMWGMRVVADFQPLPIKDTSSHKARWLFRGKSSLLSDFGEYTSKSKSIQTNHGTRPLLANQKSETWWLSAGAISCHGTKTALSQREKRKKTRSAPVDADLYWVKKHLLPGQEKFRQKIQTHKLLSL